MQIADLLRRQLHPLTSKHSRVQSIVNHDLCFFFREERPSSTPIASRLEYLYKSTYTEYVKLLPRTFSRFLIVIILKNLLEDLGVDGRLGLTWVLGNRMEGCGPQGPVAVLVNLRIPLLSGNLSKSLYVFPISCLLMLNTCSSLDGAPTTVSDRYTSHSYMFHFLPSMSRSHKLSLAFRFFISKCCMYLIIVLVVPRGPFKSNC
jgi:hypothetical protein